MQTQPRFLLLWQGPVLINSEVAKELSLRPIRNERYRDMEIMPVSVFIPTNGISFPEVSVLYSLDDDRFYCHGYHSVRSLYVNYRTKEDNQGPDFGGVHSFEAQQMTTRLPHYRRWNDYYVQATPPDYDLDDIELALAEIEDIENDRRRKTGT